MLTCKTALRRAVCILFATASFLCLSSSNGFARQGTAESVTLGPKITRLFGKTHAEVDRILGKGNAHARSFFYKCKGLRSIEIEYGNEKEFVGPPELNNKVLSLTCHFVTSVPSAGKKPEVTALSAIGLPTTGIIYGDDASKSNGYFKNVRGIPAGFIGYVDDKAVYFTHWTYLSLSMGAWSRPPGE